VQGHRGQEDRLEADRRRQAQGERGEEDRQEALLGPTFLRSRISARLVGPEPAFSYANPDRSALESCDGA
jgi:hypothetical protein